MPPLADLYHLNQGIDRVDCQEGKWFDCKHPSITPPSGSNYEIRTIKFYRPILEVLNLTFLVSTLLNFLFKELNKAEKTPTRAIVIIAGF